ncbi:MAG: hypothetical protein RIT04_354 [Candidatus Parcubacteria bacterium]
MPKKNNILIIFFTLAILISIASTFYTTVIKHSFTTEGSALMCDDAAPNLYGLFDTSIAPSFLYYSYLPIILIALALGLFVFRKNRTSIHSKSLIAIALLFSIFIINEIGMWITSEADLVHFEWQLSAILQTLVALSIVYFVWTYFHKGDISFSSKALLVLVSLPIIILAPTTLNMSGFDISQCESTNGALWSYIYVIQISLIGLVAHLCFTYYNKATKMLDKKQILFIGIASVLCLGIFSATNILGDTTYIYEFNLFGPLGILLFISILTYMTVQFKLFNIKIIGANVLTGALILAIGSLLFIEDISTTKIIVAITLIVSIVLGYLLSNGVKKEVSQRERIEQLATNLQKANSRLLELDKQKSEFVSFATHQLRAPLTAMKGYASLILEGDLGPVEAPVRDAVARIADSSKTLASVVDDYLNVSRIELGTMKYTLEKLDLKKMIESVIAEIKPNIDQKKDVVFSFTTLPENNSVTSSTALSNVPATSYMVNADRDKFKQVIENLIDNSLKYTPSGSVRTTLEHRGDSIRFTLKDTGVGILPEVMPKLFSKFTRASNANAVNIHGTGLGLFVAKDVVLAHNGKIWAESDGEGKGSSFIVELPAV